VFKQVRGLIDEAPFFCHHFDSRFAARLRVSLIRACHPRPVLRYTLRTSRSRRMLTSSLVGVFCFPLKRRLALTISTDVDSCLGNPGLRFAVGIQNPLARTGEKQPIGRVTQIVYTV
jgi:hypothetical protein